MHSLQIVFFGKYWGPPVIQVKLFADLLLGKLLKRLAQRSIFLQQMLLSVDKRISQITRPDAAASKLAAMNPGLSDALHP